MPMQALAPFRTEEEEEDEGAEKPGDEDAATETTPLAAKLRVKVHWLLRAAGKGLALLLLALAGITLPSAFSSVYYLLFVGMCTWWACHFRLSHLGFNALCIMVGVYAAGHLLCLYSYQAPYIQAFLPPTSIWARVFGLKDIILATNCSSPNALVLNTSHRWPVYVNPGVLLLLYFTMVTLLKLRRLEARRRRLTSTETDTRAVPPQHEELVELEHWPQAGDSLPEDTKG
ncbi:piezo-type mechanosensitive ion channel component 1 [Alligator mississippiensis]|uniref:Piezo-type mechanosensitive ion channel component 1 n=1 Tax=Alligator mississippiensis TaxID=8496 RepID=A0A151MZ28_ALLMI|nr:piezo-type mechanosensitive ion channel component 1 [Alligator mississippiensis]